MSINSKPPVLGLICARGGSKGVPGKNIKEFCGKPLIAWAIECAKACPEITDVVVSTDDEEIAKAAKAFGADVPFIRPPELARDNTKQIDAIVHALSFLKDQGRHYKYLALVQPTCPLRVMDDLSGAIKLMEKNDADTVITVTEEEGVYLSTLYNRENDGAVQRMFPADASGTIRQDFNPIYHRCGVAYILKADYILEKGELYGDRVYAHVVPRERAYDIDSMFDWDLCEWLMQKRLKAQL